MKKKNRRTLCKIITWLIKPFWWLFIIVSFPFIVGWIYFKDWECWLCKKFRTYDYDPD